MDNTISQQLLTLIIERQKTLSISETNLVAGIMNTTQWWRIRSNKSVLTLPHAIQLLSRVGLSFKVYEPERTYIASAKSAN